MSICVLHPYFGCLIRQCALFCQNASGVYASGLGPWEVSPASSGMLWIMTHPPNVYGPPPSTLHRFFHLFTINQLWPTLPMSYACSTVAWGVLCTVVGVLVVLGDGLGESWLCGSV